MPEQTLGGIPLGLGMVMKINFLNFHVHVPVHVYVYPVNTVLLTKSSLYIETRDVHIHIK